MGKRVYAYIDGFNFYNGFIKTKPQYKWLDLVKFCQLLMAGDNLIKVKYFTATVLEFGDPQRPLRQQIYWNALKEYNNDKIEIIKGKFRLDPRSNRIAKYQCFTNKNNGIVNTATNNSIWIMRAEEKGSDVNLAVHLLHDAWENKFDIALIITNDSDLAEGIRITKECCNKEVALANPHQSNRSGVAKELKDLNLFSRLLTENQLHQCQLPDIIPGTNIYKPPEWNATPDI